MNITPPHHDEYREIFLYIRLLQAWNSNMFIE